MIRHSPTGYRLPEPPREATSVSPGVVPREQLKSLDSGYHEPAAAAAAASKAATSQLGPPDQRFCLPDKEEG